MSTQKLIGTLFLVLVWSVSAMAQADTTLLSFESALQVMQSQNPALQRVQQEVKQKELEKEMRKGLYMPKLSVSAKAVAMSDDIHLDLTDVRDAITPIYDVLGNYGVFSGVLNPDPATNAVLPVLPDNMSTAAVRQQLLAAGEQVASADWDPLIQEKNFATVSADIVWPLFTGGKIAGANKAASVEVEFSQLELRKVEGELLTELVTRYYGLSLAIQAADVMRERFDAMQKHYNDAQKMFDEGMIAKVEFLNASVAKSDAEREYKQALRNVVIIRAGLNATLANDTAFVYLPASHLFINKEFPALSYWIAQTDYRNPQLKQIECKRNLVEIKSKVNKGKYLPTVALMGTYNLADYKLSPYTPEWLVGAGLNWSVFEGFARNKQIKADQTLTEQVNYAEEKAHDDLEAYLTKLYNELQVQLEQIEELDNTLELAKEYSSSTKKAFKEGFTNSTTVVEAQSKLALVKALRLKAFYQYDVTLSALLQVTGIPEQFLIYASGENTIVESLN